MGFPYKVTVSDTLASWPYFLLFLFLLLSAPRVFLSVQVTKEATCLSGPSILMKEKKEMGKSPHFKIHLVKYKYFSEYVLSLPVCFYSTYREINLQRPERGIFSLKKQLAHLTTLHLKCYCLFLSNSVSNFTLPFSF